MGKPAVVVDNVSMKFNLSKEKVDNLKDYLIKFIKKEIKYNEFWALQNVNFEVQKGDRVGILGLNGAGKSTLLKVIAGVFKPTEGKVIKNGRLVPLLELGAGFDPQYTGRENIYLYGAMLGYSKSFIEEKFDEIVEFSELKEFIDVPIKNYSSGMKARLGFSIATLVSPDILILDEVLSVGDAKFRKPDHKPPEEGCSLPVHTDAWTPLFQTLLRLPHKVSGKYSKDVHLLFLHSKPLPQNRSVLFG